MTTLKIAHTVGYIFTYPYRLLLSIQCLGCHVIVADYYMRDDQILGTVPLSFIPSCVLSMMRNNGFIKNADVGTHAYRPIAFHLTS